MRRPREKLIAGIDLHSNNVMIGIINQDGKRIAHRKLDCDLKEVIQFLQPLKPQLQSMAVESTFNWYWLVDGLRAQGFVRVRIDGTVHEMDALPKLAKNAKHSVDLVVDRLKARLSESRFESEPFTADSVLIMKSDLQRTGAVYSTLRTIKLKA